MANYIEKCDLVWSEDGEPLYLNSHFEQRVEREATLRCCEFTPTTLRPKRASRPSSARVSRSSSSRKSQDDDDAYNARRNSSSSFTHKFVDRVRRISLTKPRSPEVTENRSIDITSR